MTTPSVANGAPHRAPAPRRRGALRVLFGALAAALLRPSVWLTAWLLVTVPALLAVWPVVAAQDRALARHPGASFRLDQALDLDFARQFPDVEVAWLGGALFATVAFALLGGGILAGVGGGRRLRYRELLAAGARALPRNVRVLLVGVVVCVLVFWGAGWLDRSLRQEWLYEADPGAALFGSPWLTLEMGLAALDYLWGLVFLGLVFVAKLAMARLTLHDRRSAVLAWLGALWYAARHPLRLGAVVASFAVLWLGVAYGAGLATAHALEVRGALWLGLASGQAGMVATQILAVASFVAARELVADEVRTPAPPDPLDQLALDRESPEPRPLLAAER